MNHSRRFIGFAISRNSNSYKITTGKKEHPVNFRMQILHPNTNDPYPVMIDGDMCFSYFTNTDYVKTATGKNIAWAFWDCTEIAHDIRTEGRRCGHLYGAYPEYTPDMPERVKAFFDSSL